MFYLTLLLRLCSQLYRCYIGLILWGCTCILSYFINYPSHTVYENIYITSTTNMITATEKRVRHLPHMMALSNKKYYHFGEPGQIEQDDQAR